jgi:muconolactone delta-isomerase
MLQVLRDTIQPFPSLAEICAAALKPSRPTSRSCANRSETGTGAWRAFTCKEDIVEFLVEFEVNIPDGIPKSEVKTREDAEASAAAKLVDEGHLVRLWRRPVAEGESNIVALYRAESEAELGGLLGALPLPECMHITVAPLEPHPNDPATASTHPLEGRSQP